MSSSVGYPFALILLAGAALCASSASHAVTVCASGCDFTSIGAALDDPGAAGQDVVVDPGTYTEGGLTVVGRVLQSSSPDRPASTIIDGSGIDEAVIGAASNATIRGFTITGGNQVGAPGGGIRVTGGTVVLQDLIIENNRSDLAGGGVGTNTGSSIVTASNVVVRNNTAGRHGGGFYWPIASILTITNSEITDNTVLGGSVPVTATGGGIRASDLATLVVQNTEISGNRLQASQRNFGAGIFTSASKTSLNNVDVSNNTALPATTTSQGGGIYFTSSGGHTLSIGGGSVSGNSAGTSGGGIFCTAFVSGSLSIPGGAVTGNTPEEIFGCLLPELAAGDTPADAEQSGSDADPVNTFTGDLFDTFPADLDPGGPGSLRFVRHYSSGLLAAGVTGALGSNWRHNFEWSLRRVGDAVDVVDDRGRLIEFTEAGGSWNLGGQSDVAWQLATAGAGFALLDPRTRLARVFDAVGHLVTVADGKGNELTLTWDGNAITQVSDGLGRRIDFAYTAGKLTSIASDARTVIFDYTGKDLSRVTHADGTFTTYAYDPGGLLTAVTRPEGNVPFMQTWNAEGQVATQTDAAENTHEFAYAGATTTLTGPDGGVRLHTHTVSGQLTSRQDQGGDTFSFTSDADGRRASITDRLGDTTTHTFDADSGAVASIAHADGTTTGYEFTSRTIGGLTYRDLTRITHGDGAAETFAYDTAGNLTAHTDRNGNARTATFNARGQVLTVTNRLGGITSHTYDADGTRATTTDPAGNLTTYVYDTARRLATVTLADGNTRTFSYDAGNRLLATTDAGGARVSLTYDDNGRVATATDPLGNTTSIGWDGNNRWTGSTNPAGATISRSYDALGRTAATTNEAGATEIRAYDALGRLTTLTDARGNAATASYDAEGVITSRTDRMGNTTTVTTDGIGRVVELETPAGRRFAFTYDGAGRIETTTDPLGNVTTFERDPNGLLTGVTLPGGTVGASYARNAAGQITALTDGNGNVWRTTYDNMGRKTGRTDPLGNARTFTYDKRNRVDTITLPGATASLAISYDAAGNPTRVAYTDGTTLDYGFDARRQLTSANGVTRSFDASGLVTNSNTIIGTRDPAGRLESLTLAAGKTITYSYDANNNVTRIVDWTAAETTFAYDANDRLSSVTRPNGIVTTYVYDADGRLAGLTEGAVSAITLVRDGNGHVTADTRDLPEPSAAGAALNVNLSYDAAAQITANAYDDMGRVTSDAGGTYVWDLASRLTSTTRGGETVVYTYDGLHRRLSRVAGGATRSYVWNDALGLPSVSIVRDDAGDLRYYVHTPGGRLLYSMEAADDVRHDYHFDEMGNTLFLSNVAGAVAASYAHSPYGRLLGRTGSADNPFTWQGEFGVFDDDNGLYFARARYYDSATARFVSRDPVWLTGPHEVNPYQYARGNPLENVDPRGDQSVPSAEELALDVLRANERAVRARAERLDAEEQAFSIKRDLRNESDAVYNFRNELEHSFEQRTRAAQSEAIKVRVALDTAENNAVLEDIDRKRALLYIADFFDAKPEPSRAATPDADAEPAPAPVPESVREANRRHGLDLPETPTLPPPDELRDLLEIYQHNTEEGHKPFRVDTDSCIDDLRGVTVLC